MTKDDKLGKVIEASGSSKLSSSHLDPVAVLAALVCFKTYVLPAGNLRMIRPLPAAYGLAVVLEWPGDAPEA